LAHIQGAVWVDRLIWKRGTEEDAMAKTTAPTEPRRAAYQEWRQRLSDEQAIRREPLDDEPALDDRWDPSALFVYDDPPEVVDPPITTARHPEPVELAAEQAAEQAVDQAVERRAVPAVRPVRVRRPVAEPATGAVRPADPAPSSGSVASDDTKSWDENRYRALLARRDRTNPAPAAPVLPPPPAATSMLPPPPASTTPRPSTGPSISDALHELNRARLEGEISDEEFNAKKAALFHARRTMSQRRALVTPG
jgi:hypothetical protein